MFFLQENMTYCTQKNDIFSMLNLILKTCLTYKIYGISNFFFFFTKWSIEIYSLR